MSSYNCQKSRLHSPNDRHDVYTPVSPIINQPQTGILSTGTLQKRPLVITDAMGNDAIAIRSMIYLSFVFDHRILDGAAADGFLSAVKRNLENI